MSVNISFSNITLDGYLILQNDTSYNLFGNQVIDGTTFKGISGGNIGTHLNGQGYTISVSGSYDAFVCFPTPIQLSNLTLINPVSSGSWGSAIPDSTCYAFVGPLSAPISIGSADISGDNFIHVSVGNQYLVSEDLVVDGFFSGFKIEGSGNVMIDCAGHTVTMRSSMNGGLMTNAGNASLLVKNLVVDASGVNLANGNGWIFGSSFASSNMIAMNCHVTCGGLDFNSGGIFGGNNQGFVCATECSVVCGTITNTYQGGGGGGGMCGGSNAGSISITDCTATIGDVMNPKYGGGGGMCGGYNGTDGRTVNISITGCTATITGSVSNSFYGGGGGMCGGFNGGNVGTAHIYITDCTATIGGSMTNDSGGGGGMCGGLNGYGGTATISITDCTATIGGDVTNTGSGGGGLCGGFNGYVGSATISITDCTATIGGSVTNSGGYGGGGMCGGANGNNTGGIVTISITGCTANITGNVSNEFGGGGGGGMCGGLNGLYGATATISITDCMATITGSVTNTGSGGGGGMCGGLNGFSGSANISISECLAEISGDVKFGSILGADMTNITIYPHAPYDLSLNVTILSWIGGDDVSYNVYIGGSLYDLSGLTGFSADISGDVQYGNTFTVKAVYNGIESVASVVLSTILPFTPINISFNGRILSWDII